MQNLLIVGCGDVARRTLPWLTRCYRVYALVRKHDPQLAALGVTQIRGDLDRPETLGRLAGLAQLVLHFAPPQEFSGVNENGPNLSATDPRTKRLIAVLRRGKSVPRRLVYISTSGVYGDCGGALIDETRPYQALTARAQRRVDAERQLRRFGRTAGGPSVCIIRAPGIYAQDRLPLERLRRGDPALATACDPYSNHIHAEDLGRACIAALRYGRPNRAYHASDDSQLRMGDYFDTIADALSLPRPPRVDMAEAEAVLSPAMLSFMRESRRMDNSRMKRELKLRLKYPTVGHALAGAPPPLDRPAGEKISTFVAKVVRRYAR